MYGYHDPLYVLLFEPRGTSLQLGFFTASWVAMVVTFFILPVTLWCPRDDQTEQRALSSVTWFSLLGLGLSGIPLLVGRWDSPELSSWSGRDTWNRTYIIYGFLVGMVFPSLTWWARATDSRAADSALHAFMTVGLYPWRAIVGFFARYGGKVAAGAGIWVALGCLNFFWPALTILLFLYGVYVVLTTPTQFGFVWFFIAAWFAFAQLCGVLGGIWALLFPSQPGGSES